MIFGTVEATDETVETHKDSYVLSSLTVVSVRRPFLPAGIMFGLGGSAFALSFGDLLYLWEFVALIVFVGVSFTVGVVLGQIQLLSRDLQGSDLSGMIWGTYGDLQKVRKEIGAALKAKGLR